jgi:hypothetical protein
MTTPSLLAEPQHSLSHRQRPKPQQHRLPDAAQSARRPIDNRILRIQNHLLVALQARSNCHTRAEVRPQRHGQQLHLMLRVHRCHLHAVRSKQQRVARQRERRRARAQREMHLRICARQQIAVAIIDIDFDQHRPLLRIDGAGSACHCPRIMLRRRFSQRQKRALLRANLLRVRLRHVYINPQPIRLRDVKQFLRRTACAACIDQRADIDVARGHRAVERRIDFLERLGFFEPRDVETRGIERGFLREHVADLFVGFLFRHRLALQHVGPAIRCTFRQREIGLGIREIGARGAQLIVHFRCIDFREQLAVFHVRADIGVPLLQIAVGARVNRRIEKRLHVAG